MDRKPIKVEVHNLRLRFPDDLRALTDQEIAEEFEYFLSEEYSEDLEQLFINWFRQRH